MTRKANVGDFPLKVYPCKYWWVRYAVACTYFSDQQTKLMKAYSDEIKLPKMSAYSGASENRRIWVEGLNDEHLLNVNSEEHEKLNAFITKYHDHDSEERIGWLDCPFEELDQSKCPFYETEPYYENQSLEELREHKGYEV